ncbi:hypothetical protein K461DRAFT_323620 [Myriangium duriaei CBS 260.36]|uniref:Mid2 domain-containing protein n=1 Tax=Myriangium duriaei CBS 260.36 TaxID=1168546 RepID=A0A9P4IWK6_9PEZI|nr:hypothetical protein K461DRAFT_323620 [Myriangium duriaei CBS 260.36]
MDILILLSFFGSVAATCYMSNGTAQSDAFKPCQSFHGSYCCELNVNVTVNNVTQVEDACLDNGLCKMVEDKTGIISYWREGCSDPSWPSDWCLTGVCGNGVDNNYNNDAAMTPCDGTASSKTWCCGHNNTACCGKGLPDEYTISPTIAGLAAYRTSQTQSTVTTSSTTSQSSTPNFQSATPASSSTIPPSKGVSGGAKAGIGIGVGLGLIALVSVAVLLIFMRKRRAQKSQATSSDTAEHSEHAYMWDPQPGTGPAELQTSYTDGPAEMEAYKIPCELEGATIAEKDGSRE